MFTAGEEFFITNNSTKMEDEINQIATLAMSNKKQEKNDLILQKKKLARYLKREKIIKRKFSEKRKSYSMTTKSHENVLTSIPFLKEKINELEKRLVDFNKSVVMTLESNKLVQFEKEDYEKMIVIIAGNKSRFTGETISKDMHLSKGEINSFMSPYNLSDSLGLLDEYLEYTLRLDTIDKSIIGLYMSQDINLTTNDISFLLIAPSTRNSLRIYMNEINRKIKEQ